MPRTDHSQQIADARETADRAGTHMIALDWRVVADLLEMHDATGINLHEAPNLLAFVERSVGPVENNFC